MSQLYEKKNKNKWQPKAGNTLVVKGKGNIKKKKKSEWNACLHCYISTSLFSKIPLIF